MNKSGKVIVIDGLDGCGKSTQFELCTQKLEKMGKKIKASGIAAISPITFQSD